METRVKVGITAFTGMMIVIIGIVLGWYGLPAILDNMLQKNMVLTPTSASFKVWQAPTDKVEVLMQFILFNVTNAENVTTRGAKPHLQEIGPFSYKESRRRVNVTWSRDGRQLTFREMLTYRFDPATSGDVSQNTTITTVNAPMLMLQQLVETLPLAILLRPLVSAVMGPMLGRPFVTVPVRELLFDGSPVPTLSSLLALPGSGAILDGLCGRGLCGSARDLRRLQDGRFPSMMYNNSLDGPYTILTGKDDIQHFTYIQSYRGNTSLSYWSSPFCNMLNGTDGITYPPHMETRDRIYVFNKDFCRSIYLDYEQEVEHHGIAGRRYVPGRGVLEDPAVNGDNACFCSPPSQCLKAGVMSLSPCQFGAPIVVSTPHFYNGASEYLNSVEGLSPNKQQHETFIDIEPLTGLALGGAKRVQINIDLARFGRVSEQLNLPHILFPILHINEMARLDAAVAAQFRRQLQQPLSLVTVARWLLVALGSGVLLASLVHLRHLPHCGATTVKSRWTAIVQGRPAPDKADSPTEADEAADTHNHAELQKLRPSHERRLSSTDEPLKQGLLSESSTPTCGV